LTREVWDRARQRVPVRLWARAPPEDAIRQLVQVASAPWAEEVVAGMADLHVATGVAVGTVFATARTVVPAALGADLGCGMRAARLAIGGDLGDGDVCARLDRARLEALVDALDRGIPTGDATHRGRGVPVADALLEAPLSTRSLEHAREALARRHLGTLGGGNHFLELDRDAEGGIWLLIHSGSRGLGATIAVHHKRAAEARGAHDRVPSGLDVERAEGAAYVGDLAYALAFAQANRSALQARALAIVSELLGEEVRATEEVELHHNFVARERWGGRELWVHRKGAVRADAGAPALIPGSMGTASYLVEGLGNPASLGSCSHGAGRVMTRTEARARVTEASLARATRHVVLPERRGRALVEEAPAAYRDVREVLEDQRDLVVRRRRLEPIAVLKG
jgi:tRNA-splicing ligase RtcB